MCCSTLWNFFVYFWALGCVGHSFAYVTHFVFLRDVWIRTQRAPVASRRAANLVTYLPNLATHLHYETSYMKMICSEVGTVPFRVRHPTLPKWAILSFFWSVILFSSRKKVSVFNCTYVLGLVWQLPGGWGELLRGREVDGRSAHLLRSSLFSLTFFLGFDCSLPWAVFRVS